MPVDRIAVVVLLGVPLAGCFSVSLPPKPLPDWAMSQQAEWITPARTKAARIKPARSMTARRAPDRTSAISYVTPSASAASANAHAQPADVKPFSPEWQAREDAFDSKLRRTMNICNGC